MNRFEILKAARNKRRLGVRDFRYFDLEEMVHESLLHKTFPRKARVPGWPVYIISRKGLKSLEKYVVAECSRKQ